MNEFLTPDQEEKIITQITKKLWYLQQPRKE